MSGKMRKRVSTFTKDLRDMHGLAKSFHASQKDSSKRSKRRAKLNNYKQQKEEDQ